MNEPIKDQVSRIEALIAKTSGAAKPLDQKLKSASDYDKVRAAVRVLSNDTNFRLMMRYMAKICCQFEPEVVYSTQTGEILPQRTLENACRRKVYLDFRKMLTDEARRLIESKGEEDSDGN